jgi:hypothetical protein
MIFITSEVGVAYETLSTIPFGKFNGVNFEFALLDKSFSPRRRLYEPEASKYKG